MATTSDVTAAPAADARAVSNGVVGGRRQPARRDWLGRRSPLSRRRLMGSGATLSGAGALRCYVTGAAGAALAACGVAGPHNTLPAASKEPVTLEYYTGGNVRHQSNYQVLLIDPFQKMHPTLTVKIIPSEGDFYTKLRTLIVGGTPPELTWEAAISPFLGNVYRESLRRAGKLDPIRMLPTAPDARSQVIQPAYNKMLAGEAGVATTLREIKAPLQALVPKDLP